MEEIRSHFGSRSGVFRSGFVRGSRGPLLALPERRIMMLKYVRHCGIIPHAFANIRLDKALLLCSVGIPPCGKIDTFNRSGCASRVLFITTSLSGILHASRIPTSPSPYCQGRAAHCIDLHFVALNCDARLCYAMIYDMIFYDIRHKKSLFVGSTLANM